jgi:hypothetical protein
MPTKLEPNETGLAHIPIEAKDAASGYILVEDWEGNTHRIQLRSNEGAVVRLPVPKITKQDVT